MVSLQKLLVREKAGAESRGIYLISSNPADPEMFELKVHKPKDKLQWIQAIRNAVQNCPEEDDENNMMLSAEERQKILENKQENIRQITGITFIFVVSSIFFKITKITVFLIKNELYLKKQTILD